MHFNIVYEWAVKSIFLNNLPITIYVYICTLFNLTKIKSLDHKYDKDITKLSLNLKKKIIFIF